MLLYNYSVGLEGGDGRMGYGMGWNGITECLGLWENGVSR